MLYWAANAAAASAGEPCRAINATAALMRSARCGLEDLAMRHVNTTFYVTMSSIIPSALISNQMGKLKIAFCVRGVISPLLSNIYLHWFDKVFYRPDGPVNWANARLIRYADDFVILARYQGERLTGWIESKLETWMGLEINREKTRVVDLQQRGESLDFLGYTFRYDRDLKGRDKQYLNVCASKKALARERESLREKTGPKQCFKPVPMLIEEINRHLAGWSNYFRYGYPRKAFRQINRFVRSRLVVHLKRRSQRPFRPPEGVTFYEHLNKLGLVYL
jgi:RNA-directed DNA polymerase